GGNLGRDESRIAGDDAAQRGRVDLVVVDAVAAAHDEPALSAGIPGDAESRRTVVEIVRHRLVVLSAEIAGGVPDPELFDRHAARDVGAVEIPTPELEVVA